MHSVNHHCKLATLPPKDIGISVKWWGMEKKKESAVTKRKMCLVAQSCLTLCDPMGCNPPCSSVHGDSPGNKTGVGCHALLQGIFPPQRSIPRLSHCRKILYWVTREAGRGKQQAFLLIGENIFCQDHSPLSIYFFAFKSKYISLTKSIKYTLQKEVPRDIHNWKEGSLQGILRFHI